MNLLFLTSLYGSISYVHLSDVISHTDVRVHCFQHFDQILSYKLFICELELYNIQF